jgi:Cof subfamily protein (haloacid dehalogenase superfamily)
MYKLITIDVDDTLLNDDRIVPEGTKAALDLAIEQGVIVTLATGRMFASAHKIAKQLEMNVPLITYQGSLIKNLLDETILYERSVPQDVAHKLYEYAEQHGLHLQVYVNDILYCKEDNQKIRDYSAMSNVSYTIYDDFGGLMRKPLTKMLIFDKPQVLDQLAVELKSMFGDKAYITKSKPYFLEIMHKEGTKGHAVKFLAEHFGVSLSEVIAIGDSWNDHEMIEVAGLGVAMGNAVDSLKSIADYVTFSNNEDGVKHVIEKFILQKEIV